MPLTLRFPRAVRIRDELIAEDCATVNGEAQSHSKRGDLSSPSRYMEDAHHEEEAKGRGGAGDVSTRCSEACSILNTDKGPHQEAKDRQEKGAWIYEAICQLRLLTCSRSRLRAVTKSPKSTTSQ